MYKEYTRPLEQSIDADKNVFSVLEERVRRAPNDSLVEYKNEAGEWSSFNAAEFQAKVIAIAKGLIARGIMPGDSVSITAHTCWQWTALDLAIMSIGALTVPVYETNSPAQVTMIFNDSKVKMAFAEDDGQRDKIESVRAQCPDLGDVYVIRFGAIDTIIEYGRSVSDAEFYEREHAVKGSDLATIVYTSGSTGTPKGIELSHANFVFITYSGVNSMPDIAMKPNRRLLLFLPLAHCFARFIQYCSIASDDGVVGYLPDTKTLLPDVRSFEPTYLLGVPRVFEKVYNAASRKAGTGWKGRLFFKAAEAARDWSRMEQAGEKPTMKQTAQHLSYEASVYRTVRGALGPRIRYVACGGAPLDASLAHFFAGIGLPMIQGYGMTETAAPFAATRVTDNVIGTVGQPAPGSSVRISTDGELQVKGPNVFLGYHNLPDKTAEVFTEDGWLCTGDLASIDDEGRITITGRKKDIIITAGGKNVSPIPMEQEIAKCPIVEHAVVVGDNRPFIGALVTLDPEGLAAWLPTVGLSADTPLDRVATTAAVHDEIQQYVDKANATVSRAESVRKFVVLDTQFTQGNKCLTPSLKVVRPAVNRIFADVIDQQLYNGKR